MTDTPISIGVTPPEAILTRLIERHGAWPTLRALWAVLIRRGRRRAQADSLPDHLRRDIGLPERGEPPPLRHPWP
ncbi:hypothetical protein [Sinisalibacter aestuarii]|uniref:DUF1127 domain-containing protein n=1 Tax=Sinisalibacter aestuarii TaxID=2949426 RepID=A0ABQ5LW01_9RHOB|nr:hypothetical protein [Sinisalibacter aestuarii]GKY89175.1 hypothetical protein STA1M1_30440 [Sinisalibacter aestuarii]